jgi:hypothetical protein
MIIQALGSFVFAVQGDSPGPVQGLGFKVIVRVMLRV